MPNRARISLAIRALSDRTCVASPRGKALEWRIVQSYLSVLRAPPDNLGQRTCLLARHGSYEIRLIEPTEMPEGHRIPFWVELFDRERRTTLNSFGSEDLEEAAVNAEALIAEAEMLHRQSLS